MAKPELHYHACKFCRLRYPDACTTPKENGKCPSCRMGRKSVHMTGIEPAPCCVTDLRLARKDEIKTYRLAGSAPWWICTTCCRQFGYDVRIRND